MCGNLPLLLPLVRSWFSSGDTTQGYYKNSSSAKQRTDESGRVPTIGHRSTGRKPSAYDGFTIMQDSPTGSEVELQQRVQDVPESRIRMDRGYGVEPQVYNEVHDTNQDAAILVETSVDVAYANGHLNRAQPYVPGLVTGNHTVTASAF